jgi:broad specificity phosphatase PhoE
MDQAPSDTEAVTSAHHNPRLILLRHRSAPSEWATRGDPRLDDRGRRQAQLAGRALTDFGPMPFLCSLFGDAMLVTHMAGINILLGRAISSRQTMPFWPANCSINVIETGDRRRIVASAASCP